MEHLDKIRKEIGEFFNPNLIIQESRTSKVSPSAKFRMESVAYKQDKNDTNWNVTRVEIYDNRLNEIIFSFFINDDSFFFDWINKNRIEYFICAEDIFGGQTIIDLTNKKMSSYSIDEDGFIWTSFFPSPDKSLIAIRGCYWAGPDLFKIYEFKEPLKLPLKEIQEVHLKLNDEEFIKWIDNSKFITRGKESLDKIEYLESGGMRFIKINGKELERTVEMETT